MGGATPAVARPNLPCPPIPAMSLVSRAAHSTPVATTDPSVIQLNTTGATSGPPETDSVRSNNGPTIIEFAPPTQPPKVEKTVNKPQIVDHVAFVALLQCCASGSSEEAPKAVAQLKDLAKGESGLARVCTFVKEWLVKYHAEFVNRTQAKGRPLLEAELYASWLAECQSLVTVMYVRAYFLHHTRAC